jgi:hypothetical protein
MKKESSSASSIEPNVSLQLHPDADSLQESRWDVRPPYRKGFITSQTPPDGRLAVDQIPVRIMLRKSSH